MSLLFPSGQPRYGQVRVHCPVLLSVVPAVEVSGGGVRVHSVCQPTPVLCTNSVTFGRNCIAGTVCWLADR